MGDTGFLHRRDNGADFLWTRFADKSTTVVTALAGASTVNGIVHSAGGDFVAWLKPGSPTTITMVNLADQTSRVLTLPAGFTSYLAATATTVLARGSVGGVGTVELITYAADGSSTMAPVGGVLAGAAAVVTPGGLPPFSDANGTIVMYSVGGVLSEALVDLHTGAVAAIPGASSSFQLALSDDYIVRTLPGSTLPVKVAVFSRPGLANGTDTSSTTITLPSVTVPRLFIAGHHLLVTNSGDESVADVPLDGGAATTALTQSATAGVMAGPHDTVLAIGANAGVWVAHRFSGGAGGTLVDDASIPATIPIANAGISIESGLLHHVVAAQPAATPVFQSIDQPIVHGPDDAQYTGTGSFRPTANTCQTGVNCLRVVPGSWDGQLYLMSDNEISTQTTSGTIIPNKVWPWGPGAVIADGSYYYAIVDVPSANQQYVISTGTNTVLSTGTITGAAVWYSKLFQSSATAGSVIESDLDDATVPKLTIPTGASCKPTELQADNDWLYWSCGTDGPAGVHNLVTGADVALPAGVAQIGDGFVVMHDVNSGVLKLYDVHSGTLAGPVTIGTAQTGFVTDDRLITWAVDKRSGDIAYVAADDSVHVVDPGVPHTAARDLIPFPEWWSAPHNPTGPWSVGFFPNRPLTSWTINITSPTLGQVKTLTGGATRGSFAINWDGLNSAGAMVPTGTYNWAASFTTTDGTTSVGSGKLQVICGAYVYRSYDCDGAAAILGVKVNSQSTWYSADTAPTGGIVFGGWTDSWPWGTSSSTFSAIVPWGDYNGDGYGDVIARTGTGTLKAYLGVGQANFGSSAGVKTVTISSGWQSYKILLTTGDLTGDGVYDMLATDSSGNLYLMAGKAAGGFAAKVKIGSGWQKYTKLVGVGDITGDKHPDILGFDSSGNMMLYAGTGKGTLAAGVKLGTGFSAYTAIVGPGDINRDGHNDLVARDKNGVLWLFPGNGTHGFGARKQIGVSWNTFLHIF